MLANEQGAERRGRVIVLFGPSGAGKTTALEFLAELLGDQIVVGRKFSTRPRRLNDKEDVRVGLSDADFGPIDISYLKHGYRYGLDTREIRNILSVGKSYCVVMQDLAAAAALKAAFTDDMTIIYVDRPIGARAFLKISEDRGMPPEESRSRWIDILETAQLLDLNRGAFNYILDNSKTLSRFRKDVVGLAAEMGLCAAA